MDGGQGHEAEDRNPTVEGDEQTAVATEAAATETENSIGGGANHEEGQEEDEVTAMVEKIEAEVAAEQKEEDELVEKAQKLMDSITTTGANNNPNPTILHALSHLLESQESLYVVLSRTFTFTLSS